MAAHKHAWETLHIVRPTEVDEERAGEVGFEHDGPYRTEFCPGCGEKQIVPLDASELAVAETLDLTAENRT